MSTSLHTQRQPSDSHHSPNHDAPPPEYSVHVPNMRDPSSSRHPSVNTMPGHYLHREQSLFSSSSAGTQFPNPMPFGPTPLTQSQPTLDLLPYHDPRSAHSTEVATLRARRRFIGAAFWAMGLIACFLLIGALTRLQVI